MCLAVLAWHASTRFPLVLASNRDEFLDREAAALAWWRPDGAATEVLSGRDLSAGGTWLGLTRQGRFALLTNVREALPRDPKAPSRGDIVIDWLSSADDAAAFEQRTRARGHAGFNAIVADLAQGQASWFSNRAPEPKPLEAAALHGLSNAALDTPWPKVQRLKRALDDGLSTQQQRPALIETLLQALRDRAAAPDADLPDTGVGLLRERALSPPFIAIPGPDGRIGYGTRCSTVVVAERSEAGVVLEVVEQRYGADGEVAGRTALRLDDWPVAAPRSGGAQRPIR